MSKLKQLLSYLSQPDATELVFKAGAPTMLGTSGRDVPVTVTALGLAGIRRFFDGTAVAERLARGSGSHETEIEIDGKRYVCNSTAEAGKLEVRVRVQRDGAAASLPRSQRPTTGAARVDRVSPGATRARDAASERVDRVGRRSEKSGSWAAARSEPGPARIDERNADAVPRAMPRSDSSRSGVREEPRAERVPRSDSSRIGVREEPRAERMPRSDSSRIGVREEPRAERMPRSDSSRIGVREEHRSERMPRVGSTSSRISVRDEPRSEPTPRVEARSRRAEEDPPRRAPDPVPDRIPPAASVPAPVPAPPPMAAEAPVTDEAPPPVRSSPSGTGEFRPLGRDLVTRRSPRPATPRINGMLRDMIERGASDLHLSSGSRPMLRVHGKIEPLDGYPALDRHELSSILLEIIDDNAYEDFVHHADADFAHAVEGLARFRSNYFADRHGIGAVFRQIPMDILTPDKLGLPEQVLDLCWLSKGLVLVTGPTGSGKSTTLAALIDFINRNRDDHIITIEDPIEFVHENKRCLINQREVGRHTRSFKSALRAALREDPDVILVGELRDLETVAIALETAETGHLVFGTLHTTTAPSTVDRIIDQFPGDQQAQIRTMLGESLRGVIGQTLLRRKKGGRVAAYEILLHTAAVGNLIREGKTHQLKNTMQVSKHLGMQNLNDHLIALVMDGVVDAQEAYVKSVDKQNLREMYKKAAIQVDLPRDD